MSVVKKEKESAFRPVQKDKEEFAGELKPEFKGPKTSENVMKELLTKISIP